MTFARASVAGMLSDRRALFGFRRPNKASEIVCMDSRYLGRLGVERRVQSHYPGKSRISSGGAAVLHLNLRTNRRSYVRFPVLCWDARIRRERADRTTCRRLILAPMSPRISTVLRARAAPRTPTATAHSHVQRAGRRPVGRRRPPGRCSSRAGFSCSRRRGGVFSAARRGPISPFHGSAWRGGRRRERFHTIPAIQTTTTRYVTLRVGTKLI